jgi:proteasome lid subunit RPN8/RPN11
VIPAGRDVPGRQPLLIPADLLELMLDHCRREAPLEGCGILGGIFPLVSSFHPLRNAAASPTRYDADPRDIIAANRRLRERHEQYLAIYHSHPQWEALPSRADLERNFYGLTPRLIVSLLHEPPDVRLWRLYRTSYRELAWKAVPPGVAVEPGENPRYR